MKDNYLKLKPRVIITALVLIWVIAMISIFYNIKYRIELIEKEQKINTLINITEVLKID